MKRRMLMLAPLALVAACDSHVEGNRPLRSALADMDDVTGMQVGTVRIARRGGHDVLILRLRGMPPGTHGLHFHAVGMCEGPEFASAGPHLNPEGHQHGTANPMGHHLGDLPNVTANSGGWIKETIPLDVANGTLAEALFDADGTAIVLHAGPDDYRTDPSGSSGKRIACGVFKRE